MLSLISILRKTSCYQKIQQIEPYMAVIRSIHYLLSAPRLKESRMDLPKKPVPPMTKSVGIPYYLLSDVALKSGDTG
jgi:hypothetical protein